MLVRHLITAFMIIAALVCDLALPVWFGNVVVLPSALDLALLAVFLRLNGAELVFWGGCIGLLQDDLLDQPLGLGIIIASSLALIVPALLGSLRTSQTLIDRSLSAIGILLLTGIFRSAAMWWLNPDSPWIGTVEVTAERLAATFLTFFLFQILLAIGRSLSTRNLPFQDYKK